VRQFSTGTLILEFRKLVKANSFIALQAATTARYSQSHGKITFAHEIPWLDANCCIIGGQTRSTEATYLTFFQPTRNRACRCKSGNYANVRCYAI